MALVRRGAKVSRSAATKCQLDRPRTGTDPNAPIALNGPTRRDRAPGELAFELPGLVDHLLTLVTVFPDSFRGR
jgi:hypothetical protein